MSLRHFVEDRQAAFVVRWHSRQTARQETIAEHQYFVARNARVIAHALHYYHIDTPDVDEVTALGLCHDEVEKISGDISGQVKHDYPEVRTLFKDIERHIIDDVLFKALPDPLARMYREEALKASGADESTLEVQIVKYADRMEAYLFAVTEVKMGNGLMTDAVEQIRVQLSELDWPWLRTLRKETGLP